MDVQRQFQSAIQYARKHGTAIAIGHPRPNTVAVLKSGIKNLPDDIQLVGMGSLWRNEKIFLRQLQLRHLSQSLYYGACRDK